MQKSESAFLHSLKEAGLWREHRVRDTAQGRIVHYQGRAFLNFNSNHYLGLSTDPRIETAVIEAIKTYGIGSGSANTLSGYTLAHEKLSQTLCDWLQCESVLLFPSGYQANLAFLSACVSPEDTVILDKNSHASLFDGLKLADATFRRYRHLDVAHAQSLLKTENNWIMTESIFGMDGDKAPLRELSQLAAAHQGQLYVDEAHGLGVYGPQGAGWIAAEGLACDHIPVRMGTFGKALVGSGAFLAGRKNEILRIQKTGRPYLFTTALSPVLASAATAAIECIREADYLREHVFKLADFFQTAMRDLNLNVYSGDSPIQIVGFDSLERAREFHEALYDADIFVPLIRYPTVPQKSPRLRFSLTAAHQVEDIERVHAVLSHFMKKGAA